MFFWDALGWPPGDIRSLFGRRFLDYHSAFDLSYSGVGAISGVNGQSDVFVGVVSEAVIIGGAP